MGEKVSLCGDEICGTKGRSGGEGWLTYWGSDSQRHAVPALLDQVDDVAVVQGVDVHVVDGEDAVTHLQPAAPLRRRAWGAGDEPGRVR